MSTSQSRQPQVFLSHRHSDSKIADIVRLWIEQTTACRTKVFQSSSFAHGTKIGKPLSQELRASLWHTDVLILIYTLSDLDWSYCMWECGVATDPTSPDTRVVVLQFSDDVPAVFDDQVRVNARSKDDIHKFAAQFLTDPNFFPAEIGPITGFQPQSPQLLLAAERLFTDLASVPPTKHEKVDEWPAWPFIRLELSLDAVAQMKDMPPSLAQERILEECRIGLCDWVLCAVFGVPKISTGSTLSDLVARWKERSPGEDSRWATSLAAQIHTASQWNFPSLEWPLLKGKRATPGEWFSPVLTWVRKVPYHNRFEFDVYFMPFIAADGALEFTIALPPRAGGT
jgi:hypothetical protein